MKKLLFTLMMSFTLMAFGQMEPAAFKYYELIFDDLEPNFETFKLQIENGGARVTFIQADMDRDTDGHILSGKMYQGFSPGDTDRLTGTLTGNVFELLTEEYDNGTYKNKARNDYFMDANMRDTAMVVNSFNTSTQSFNPSRRISINLNSSGQANQWKEYLYNSSTSSWNLQTTVDFHRTSGKLDSVNFNPSNPAYSKDKMVFTYNGNVMDTIWEYNNDYGPWLPENAALPVYNSGGFIGEIETMDYDSTSATYRTEMFLVFDDGSGGTIGQIENKMEELSFYPNPVQNDIYLNDLRGNFSIVSLEGKILSTGEFDNHIDVSNFKAGNYILLIKTGTKIYRSKFLKN